MPAGHGARSEGALGSRLQLVLDEVVMMALERVWQGARPVLPGSPRIAAKPLAFDFTGTGRPGCVNFSLYRGERQRHVYSRTRRPRVNTCFSRNTLPVVACNHLTH